MFESMFAKLSRSVSSALGQPISFVVALVLVFVWGVCGPFFHYSDTWQLAINTSTTIVTFLMVFVIQNTQSRESAAVQVKLSEIIRALESARENILDAEELSIQELEEVRSEYKAIAEKARELAAEGDSERAEQVLTDLEEAA